MKVCDRWENSGFIAPGAAPGHHCGQPVIEGSHLCQRHYDQEQHNLNKFREEMENATRHLPGIGVWGKGVHCGCGEFVKDGENHPWHLAARLEDRMRIEGFKPCLDCAYRWEHTELNIKCTCEEGWVPR